MRDALKYIFKMIKKPNAKENEKIVKEAAKKYNLSKIQEDYLIDKYTFNHLSSARFRK